MRSFKSIDYVTNTKTFWKKTYFSMAWLFYHRPVSSLSFFRWSMIDDPRRLSMHHILAYWINADADSHILHRSFNVFFRYLSNTVRNFTYFFLFLSLKELLYRSWLKIIIPSGYIIRRWWIWIWRILVEVRCICSILNSRHDGRFKSSCS